MDRKTPGHLLKLAKSPDLTWSGKHRLVAEKAKRACGLHGSGVDVAVQVGAATIFFGAESFTNDWVVFKEIFIDGEYEAGAMAGASVLDLGAHKGYFAAYAFTRGATRVISYEPEPCNFARLKRASTTRSGWIVERSAIAATSGTVELALDASWTHSIVPGRHPAARTIPVEAVALEQALKKPTGDRCVVKIDIEGAEAEAVAAVPSETWDRFDQVIIEVHPWACDQAEIIDLMSSTSLRASGPSGITGSILHFRRRAITARAFAKE
jgi:FkbM family methyltransferase